MMLLIEGWISDQKGGLLLLSPLPRAKDLLADKGYDSDWFRNALVVRDITPCIPPTANRKNQHAYDKQLYRQCHKIENLFARLSAVHLDRPLAQLEFLSNLLDAFGPEEPLSAQRFDEADLPVEQGTRDGLLSPRDVIALAGGIDMLGDSLFADRENDSDLAVGLAARRPD